MFPTDLEAVHQTLAKKVATLFEDKVINRRLTALTESLNLLNRELKPNALLESTPVTEQFNAKFNHFFETEALFISKLAVWEDWRAKVYDAPERQKVALSSQ